MVEWNGISFLHTPRHLPQHQMASDASGHWGCGAWSGDRWFQVQWEFTSAGLPITTKVLLPIMVAGIVWAQLGGAVGYNICVTFTTKLL